MIKHLTVGPAAPWPLRTPGPPDRYAEAEARLVKSRAARLEPVWSDDRWRVYRVRDAAWPGWLRSAGCWADGSLSAPVPWTTESSDKGVGGWVPVSWTFDPSGEADVVPEWSAA